MSSIGFFFSLVLLALKIAGIAGVTALATFATLSWWWVVLPFVIAVVVDIILFAIFGVAMFKMFDRL